MKADYDGFVRTSEKRAARGARVQSKNRRYKSEKNMSRNASRTRRDSPTWIYFPRHRFPLHSVLANEIAGIRRGWREKDRRMRNQSCGNTIYRRDLRG
jgi:hypothetical protein